MLIDWSAVTSLVSSLSLLLIGKPVDLGDATAPRASAIGGGARGGISEDGCLSCSPCAVDRCQTNLPGGMLLLTQFWDSHPAAGPDDLWTIHGLWPDNCDGTYPANCDPARAALDPLTVLRAANETALLADMNERWVSNTGAAPSFHAHEWAKHGVCVSTLEPACYPPGTYTPHRDLVDFFRTTVALHRRYDVYAALARAGIVPTRTKTYALAELKQALRAAFGVDVVLRCRGVYLNEAWVYHYTRGRATDAASFVAIDGLAKDERCPALVRYMPKS